MKDSNNICSESDSSPVYLKLDTEVQPVDFSKVNVSDCDNKFVEIVFGGGSNCIKLLIPKENFDSLVTALDEYQGKV